MKQHMQALATLVGDWVDGDRGLQFTLLVIR